MTRRGLLLAGLGLVGLTNAVALGGAGYNRSGEPDAVLTLTQRELRVGSGLGFGDEKSGKSLRLLWRVPGPPEAGSDVYYDHGYPGAGYAYWLDAAKLAELGFDVSMAPDADGARERYEREPAKTAFVVLELAGAAHERALSDAQLRERRAAAAAAEQPDDKERAQRAEAARERLAREQDRSSRLFAVDAGLSAESLRAKYPDRSRYAIVHGLIGIDVQYWEDRRYVLAGSVNDISASAIHVPRQFARTFRSDSAATWRAEIAFGRRLEPWIVDTQPRFD